MTIDSATDWLAFGVVFLGLCGGMWAFGKFVLLAMIRDEIHLIGDNVNKVLINQAKTESRLDQGSQNMADMRRDIEEIKKNGARLDGLENKFERLDGMVAGMRGK